MSCQAVVPEVQCWMSKQGLMECQSIWNTLGKLYVRFMFLNTDLYRHREN